MHGAGNDFVVIDGAQEQIPEQHLAALARHACDRHFGIGADGFILVLPSRSANFKMRTMNPDGTESETCGNGIRVFAKYVFDRKMHTNPVLTVETPGGIKTVKLDTAGGRVRSARVDMGEPALLRSQIPMKGENTQVVAEPLKVAGRKIEITCVSMGNPHCVTFVDDVDSYPVEKMGPQIENHPVFPRRTNVEFAQLINSKELKQRTWERGAGETLACGSGSCASVVAGVMTGRTGRKVTVHLRGGDLDIEWLGNNRMYMTGPAEEVFEGEVSAAEYEQWARG
jgi:diaminopimelate epimerase